jgi:hypothetical protein
MIKRATLVWVLLAVLSGTGLFLVKYEVQALEERLAAINHDILDDMEAVHVLKAEWAWLNQPARLDDLGRRLLDMEPVSSAQIRSIADIPMRTPDADAPPSTAPRRRPADKPRKLVRNPRTADPVIPLFAQYRRTP